MTKIIAVTNQKGGVGKTTTSINVAYFLAKAGKKTLLVDFDPQSNATSGLGIDKQNLGATISEVIMRQIDLANIILPTEYKNLSIAPATPHLANTEVELAQAQEGLFAYEALQKAADYDYIIIDSPPSLSLLTVNGMIAANYVLLPVQAEFYALEGLGQLLESMKLIKKGLNPPLELLGVLLTMMDSGRLCLVKFTEVKKYFQIRFLRIVFRETFAWLKPLVTARQLVHMIVFKRFSCL